MTDPRNEWWLQYEERAEGLNKAGYHGAADDIRTLVDGLRQHEREKASALDALDAARKEPDERLVACDRAFREAWDRAETAEAEAEKWRTLYGQAFNDADTLKAERDELQAALTFYAEGKHFRMPTATNDNRPILEDEGEVARAALAAVPAEVTPKTDFGI